MVCKHCGSSSIRKNGKRNTPDGDVIQRILCKDCERESSVYEADKELVQDNVRLAKQKQRLQDSNRIERKSFRENARIENAIEAYNTELIKVFGNNKLSVSTTMHTHRGSRVGMLHLSDTHFNELVNLPHNKYDFHIASRRLQKFTHKAIGVFSSLGISEVVLAMTGDLMNSDRRLDELLAMATNRSKATFLGVQIITNMILDLNKTFNVTVISVSGNESRVTGKEVGWEDTVASDTYDTTIHNILEYMLKDKEGVTFVSGCPLEQVIDVNGHKVLLLHGHQLKGKVSDAITRKIRQYADRGIIINFCIFGHLHESYIADLFSRSSSPVGANAFSENALGLTSRASQNIHIFEEDGIDSMKIDLQNYDHYEGYPIQKELEAYNAKSADKVHQGTTIFKVVV